MTRVLRRPMFRMGGNTDQGIMSGVAPRQGYVDARLVEQLPELQKVAKLLIPANFDPIKDKFYYDNVLTKAFCVSMITSNFSS